MSYEGTARTKLYDSKRKEERGEVRIAVWVPAERVQDLREYAAELRKEAGSFQERTKKPPIQEPRIPIPVEPVRAWAYLRIEIDELAYRLVVRANGGTWVSEFQAEYLALENHTKAPNGVWRIRDDFPARIGLDHRIVETRGIKSRQRF